MTVRGPGCTLPVCVAVRVPFAAMEVPAKFRHAAVRIISYPTTVGVFLAQALFWFCTIVVPMTVMFALVVCDRYVPIIIVVVIGRVHKGTQYSGSNHKA